MTQNNSKKRNLVYKFLGGTILSVVLAGCAESVTMPDSGENGIITDEVTDPVYITFQIANSDSYDPFKTRDGEDNSSYSFSAGENETNLSPGLENHHIIFFDEYFNYVADSNVDLHSASPEEGDSKDYITNVAYLAVDRNELERLGTPRDDGNYDVPGYFLMMVNISSKTIGKIVEMAKSNGISYILTQGKNELKLDSSDINWGTNNEFFGMTSSMVLKTKGIQYILAPAVESNNVKGDDFYTFYRVAEDAFKNPITIYVERLASKFSVGIADGKGGEIRPLDDNRKSFVYSKEEFPSMTEISVCDTYDRGLGGVLNESLLKQVDWKVNILGWGTNAVQQKEYAFKSLDMSTNYFTNWNMESYSKKRNFWAEGVNYNELDYPKQAKDVNDNYPLNYFSYDNFKEQKKSVTYTPEHTWQPSVLESKKLLDYDYLRASTHILLASQLIIPSDNLDADIKKPTQGEISGLSDKYYLNEIFWDFNSIRNYIIDILGFRLGSDYKFEYFEDNEEKGELVPKEKFPIYGNEYKFYFKIGEEMVSVYDEKDEMDQIVDATFEFVDAEIAGSDGYLKLAIKKEAPDIYIHVYPTDEEGNILENEDPKFVKLERKYLKAIIDGCTDLMPTYYKNGSMYYVLAVRHNLESKTDMTNGESEVVTGDFGAVRNHWYQVNIKDITNVGSPVTDPQDPIVPNTGPKIPGLEFEVKIIDWHIIQIDSDI